MHQLYAMMHIRLKKLKCCEKVLDKTKKQPEIDQQVDFIVTETLLIKIDEYRLHRVLERTEFSFE